MNVKENLLEVLFSILPITIFIVILQFTIGKLPLETFINFIAGTVMVIIGLSLFFIGVKAGFLPIGELVGSSLVSKAKIWIIMLVTFIMGAVVTIAEPDLQVLASQVYDVSEGTIGKGFLMACVALGVGIFLALALLRMFLNIPLLYILIGSYALTFIIARFTAPEFLAISFDAGGVTTGPMTVPFILSLGVGTASTFSKKGAADDSFGLVSLASIGPILAVLILGVFYR